MPDLADARPVRRRRPPAAVLAATVAFGALATIWSVVAPLGEAPDEPAHLALVLHLADGNPYPDFDGLENQAAIIRLCRTYAAATRACPREGEPVTPTSTRRHPREEAPDKGSRPAWDDLGGDEQVGQVNQMPQHPPLYYQAMGAVLRVERAIGGGPWSTDRELALLRLANVALLVPLPLLAWWAARRFRLTDHQAVTAAVATLAVPMLTHIGSTLNNDNLLTLLGAVLAALLAGVARGDRSLRTAGAVGVVTALALLTKAFAVVFPPAVAVAYLVGTADLRPAAWRERLASLWRPVVVAGALTVALGGWWYVGNLARHGAVAPTVENDRLTTDLRPPGFQADPIAFAEEFARSLNNRFWGSFGWYTVRFPTWLAAAATAALWAAVGTVLARRRELDGSDRWQRASLLVPVALLGGFVLVRAWNLHVTTSKFQFIQGRYLFAGIVGVLVLAAVGVARWAGRWAPLAVALFAAVLQGEALRRSLSVWWGGPGLGPRGQLRALAAWSAWPGELLGLALAASLGAGIWLAASLALRLHEDAGGPVAAGEGPVGSDAT